MAKKRAGSKLQEFTGTTIAKPRGPGQPGLLGKITVKARSAKAAVSVAKKKVSKGMTVSTRFKKGKKTFGER